MLERHSFIKDSRGSVAIVFTLTTMAVVGLVGGAIDYGRWLNARDQTQHAIDAAILAGGRILQTSGGDETAAFQAAQQYYDQMKSRWLSRDTVSFAVVDSGTAVRAAGTAFITTPFLSAVGISEVPVITAGKAVVAAGGNAKKSLEISLMLDVTLSMWGQKIEDLKLAAKELIDILVWEDQSEFTSKVALVPFSETIYLGSYATSIRSAVAPDYNASTKQVSTESGSNPTFTKTSACVAERVGANAFTDAPPTSDADKPMPVYRRSSNSCGHDDPIIPLSNDKATLKSSIDAYEVNGVTAGHLGTAWAWYMLSPDWGHLWPSASRPAPYGTAKLQKIAVLMTDGEYNTQYCRGVKDRDSFAFSSDSINCSSPNGNSTDQARALCTNMKAAGITVYTVGFDLGDNQTAIETLRECATSPDAFYNTTTGDELRQAFRDIALKISTLRLVE